ncbi:hypothetical protein CDAR_96981 [Caerostris darwini]|uniref:Uncharacterized protein n=1 Tax=Caerostris darwini TaxID=1538125 RepID=A0AAV4T471_9ARAC|nr:hypothetical protein CDAR_96981 [Caerostris darwini]
MIRLKYSLALVTNFDQPNWLWFFFMGLVWKRTEETSWFWSIDAIAGEHHLPVKIYGPLQRDILTLVWKSTEEKSWFWSIDAIAGERHLPVKIYGPLQKDNWTQAKDGKKKCNHVLGRGTSKCLICKRKRKKRGETVGSE